MTIAKPFIILALAGLYAMPAAADTPGSQRRLAASESRDANQDQRIANGVANGSINTREAGRLDAREAGIERSQARLASDGNFSRRDFARVNYRENRTSRGIFRARHNRF